MYIEKVNSPEDIKKYTVEELKLLCAEIRDFLIKCVSCTGGHLAPSLGVIELTVAIHYVFDTPDDKLIWDVGHQCYPHKIITGRRDKMDTLRKFKGISGFPKRSESPYDTIETGHSSTSIAFAVSIARASRLKNKTNKTIAVIGDGAMTGGMAYEALNNGGALKDDVLVILNDNEMSIDKNVGAISNYFNKLITAPVYRKFREDVEQLIKRTPKVGDRVYNITRRIERNMKYLIMPEMMFDEFGFNYFGPVDGHDIGKLIEILSQLKKLKEPRLLHVITQKGRGYEYAEKKPWAFHGTSPFDISTGTTASSAVPSFTEVFGNALVDFAQKDKDVLGVTAAMPDGTGLIKLKKKLPNQFFDVGIAEQFAVTFSAGLALGGLKPVCAVYSTFMQRSVDQVIHDVALPRLPVIFAFDRAGIVGDDGETHQGLYDIALFKTVPDVIISEPKDENELVSLLYTALYHNDKKQPFIIRFPRGAAMGVEIKEPEALSVGKSELVREGKDVLIIALGKFVYGALDAAYKLKEKSINASVINLRYVKPLDEEFLTEEIKKHNHIITYENHSIKGGVGEEINNLIVKKGLQNKKVLNIAFPDKFIEHGTPRELMEKYELDILSLENQILNLLNA